MDPSTGHGVVLPGCDDRHRFWGQLRDRASQLRLRPDPSGGPGAVAVGFIEELDARRYLEGVDERFYSRHGRAVQMYLSALAQARRDAGLALEGCDSERVGLFQGTSRDSFAWWQRRSASVQPYTRGDLVAGMPSIGVGLAASILHTQGPSCSFSASCCSGAVAIGHAYREIAAGEVDVAFAGGHDAALCAPLFAMYRHAGLLSLEDQDPGQAIEPFALIVPGLVDTPIYGKVEGFERTRAALEKHVPRWLTAGDVADAALWMLTRPESVVASELVLLPRFQAR